MKECLLIALCLVGVLTGCAPAPTTAVVDVTTDVMDAQSEDLEEPEEIEVEETEIVISTSVSEVEAVEWVIDPPYDFDTDEMVASDFGGHFQTVYEGCTTSSYEIGTGTQWVNEVTVIEGAEEGPVIYVIAGVHGDEQAAWKAGQLLEDITIKAGTLYVLAPANPWGAYAETPSRYVSEQNDLNRSFPGDPEGTDSQQVAHIIYQDVIAVQPDFVFDLHEARNVSTTSDFLGSCLIFTSLDDMGDLFMEMILESEMGNLFSQPLNYYSPGPEGSVNRTITQELGIPTITTETFRGYEMESRITDQLDVVNYVLDYYGLVDREG